MAKVKIALQKAHKLEMCTALEENAITDYAVKTVSDTEIEFSFKCEPAKLFEIGSDFADAKNVKP